MLKFLLKVLKLIWLKYGLGIITVRVISLAQKDFPEKFGDRKHQSIFKVKPIKFHYRFSPISVYLITAKSRDAP